MNSGFLAQLSDRAVERILSLQGGASGRRFPHSAVMLPPVTLHQKILSVRVPDDDITDKMVDSFRNFFPADQRHALDLFQISVICIPEFHVFVSSYHKLFGNDTFRPRTANIFAVHCTYPANGHSCKHDSRLPGLSLKRPCCPHRRGTHDLLNFIFMIIPESAGQKPNVDLPAGISDRSPVSKSYLKYATPDSKIFRSCSP